MIYHVILTSCWRGLNGRMIMWYMNSPYRPMACGRSFVQLYLNRCKVFTVENGWRRSPFPGVLQCWYLQLQSRSEKKDAMLQDHIYSVGPTFLLEHLSPVVCCTSSEGPGCRPTVRWSASVSQSLPQTLCRKQESWSGASQFARWWFAIARRE